MAALDWSQCPAVESIPGKVSGATVFKDTRIPVATIFENLEAGLTVDEVMEEFAVTREQINAVLEFAANSLKAPSPCMFTGPGNGVTTGVSYGHSHKIHQYAVHPKAETEAVNLFHLPPPDHQEPRLARR